MSTLTYTELIVCTSRWSILWHQTWKGRNQTNLWSRKLRRWDSPPLWWHFQTSAPHGSSSSDELLIICTLYMAEPQSDVIIPVLMNTLICLTFPWEERNRTTGCFCTVTTSYQRYRHVKSVHVVFMYSTYITRLLFCASVHISPTKCNNFVCLWGLIDWYSMWHFYPQGSDFALDSLSEATSGKMPWEHTV